MGFFIRYFFLLIQISFWDRSKAPKLGNLTKKNVVCTSIVAWVINGFLSPKITAKHESLGPAKGTGGGGSLARDEPDSRRNRKAVKATPPLPWPGFLV